MDGGGALEQGLVIYSTTSPYGVIDTLHKRGALFRILAGGEDLDGDGSTDLLGGDPSYFTNTGRVTHYTVNNLDAEARVECQGALNSSGNEALIWFEGSLRITDNAFRLVAWNVPTHKFGLFFFGPNAVQFPFHDGFRCVGGPFARLGTVNTGNDGVARFDLDLTHATPPGAAIEPGTTTHFQFWFRDNVPGGSGSNLTDSCGATFVP